jgi:hypothetical protein
VRRGIGLGQPGFVFEARRDRAVADFMRIAVFVEIEQFGRQRFAAGMALTFVLVDVYFQLTGHFLAFPCISFPCRRALSIARWCFPRNYSGAAAIHQRPYRRALN